MSDYSSEPSGFYHERRPVVPPQVQVALEFLKHFDAIKSGGGGPEAITKLRFARQRALNLVTAYLESK